MAVKQEHEFQKNERMRKKSFTAAATAVVAKRELMHDS
jgi:hypothetical protein